MKRKLLSLLLVITLLAVTVSTGLPTILAAEENLLTNGDFSDYSGYTPDNWKVSPSNTAGASAEIIEDVQISDGVTANALKITTTKDASTGAAMSTVTYGGKIKIEKNASYTMTYWVKVKKITGLRTYMFEPNYIAKDGTAKTDEHAQEGQNIYSYSYDSGSTRVIRTDVQHSWTIAETGTAIDNSKVSLFITRTGSTNQVLTPDYPATNREGEWLQVIHTFATGNTSAHEAEVSYEIRFPGAVGGEVWLADFKMNVVKSEVDDYYTPTVNDDKLGCTTKDVALINGKLVEITAKAYGENKFDGWFVDGELVSEEETLTFTYDPTNPPKYEARFTKADFGIDGSYENVPNDLVAKSTVASFTDWSDSAFNSSSKDSLHFIDSHYTGTWREAKVTTEMAHSGTKSLLYSGQYGAIGRKFTGLQTNTDYIVSVYAHTVSPVDTSSNPDVNTKGVTTRYITAGNKSYIKSTGSSLTTKNNGDDGVILKYWEPVVLTDGWTEMSVQFNSGNNTEIIFWLDSSGYQAQLYLDDYSIARAPAAFKPAVNDTDLGFVSPAEGVVCVPGDEVTVTATPFDGNIFNGWYVGDEKVSDSPEYTFIYSAETAGITAHYTAGANAIPNPSFEKGYTNGQLLAQSSDLAYHDDTSLWTEDLFKDSSKDGNNKFFIDSDWPKYGKATATTEQAHTGSFSIKMSTNSRSIGYKLEGLDKDTNYAISFYAMTQGTTDSSAATVGNIVVTDAGQSCIVKSSEGKLGQRTEVTGALGKASGTGIDCRGSWKKYSIEFNTKDSTDIILWVRPEGAGTQLYIDDIALYVPVSVNISADLGGNYSTNLSSTSVPVGAYVEINASPLEGNTFAGWFDPSGKLVFADANITFKATENYNLTAKFEGYNMPPRDLFAAAGDDGTFENGTVNGWFADDPTYGDSVSWCSYIVSDYVAYEGTKSLKLNARYRNSILPINGLVPNTDYRLSFYVNQPDTYESAKIDSIGIIGENDSHLSTAGIKLAEKGRIAATSGWNKIDLYFNSGENYNLRFILRYSTETSADYIGSVFFDNMTLYQYKASDEFVNGDFEDGKTNWIGEGVAATDGNANVFSLGADESVYQSVSVDSYSSYTVSFKAKGKLTAAAQDLAKFDLNVKDYISSVSYLDAEGAEWTEYSYKVYTGVHEAINFVFAAGAEGAMIDDVAVTKDIGSQGAVLEKIDFETERFGLTSATDDSVYSIYTATDKNDPYVYSGNKSLKFTYNELLSNTSKVFNEAWLSYQPGIANNLKISMKYKVVGGKASGFINLAPEYSGTYGAEDGFEHMAANEEWQSLTFYVNNSTYAVFKTKIASIISGTAADFYVDDIIISVAPAMVMEENSKITYCERLYNAVDNEGFENAVTNNDWKGLPSTAEIVKGDALKGSHFLRASKGTHYVLAVPVKASTEYYFAASIRGTAATVGSIGVTIDSEGTQYYANRDEVPASIVNFNSAETGWKRSGFKFTTDAGGLAYVVIDVKSGALDIDSVMMFTSEYGYRYDPNDYTVYLPYDYNNLKSATTVINGGFGAQPYYKGDSDGVVDENGGSPSTGDSVAMPVMIIVLAVVASTVLMLIRKRKEGAENA